MMSQMAPTSTFFVIYDVEERFQSKFSKTLKSLGAWAILTPSAMMVKTEKSPEAVMEQLQPLIGPRDSLWLVTPSRPWSGYGDPTVDDCLQVALGPDNGNWVPKDWNEMLDRRGD